MVQERLAGVNALDKHRQWAAERKGRRSIEVLPSTRGSTDPSQKSKKRPRDGGNIATTTRSPGYLPTPPPRWDAVEVDSPSPRCVEGVAGAPETDRAMGTSPSPLTLLGGDL